MQTWITNLSYRRSAKSLDQKRLGAQIYEAIHILSSLVNLNNELITPKRDVSNHPVSKLWIGYERNLLYYIYVHMDEWKNRGYKSDINYRNFWNVLVQNNMPSFNKPFWVTKKFALGHRKILLNKNFEYYKNVWPNLANKIALG